MKPLTTQAVPLFFNESGVNTMKEEWRPVVGYEGLYEVSSLGRVRGVDRVIGKNKRFWKGKIISQEKNPYGYFRVALNRNGRKRFKVHRLVADAFLGPRPDGLVTDHINSCTTDNRIENLQYITTRENTIKGKSSLLKEHKYSKYLGVTLEKKTGRWMARKRFGEKQYHIGCFGDELEAHKAYLSFDNPKKTK